MLTFARRLSRSLTGKKLRPYKNCTNSVDLPSGKVLNKGRFMKTNRLGKVATTFAGLALAAGVVSTQQAHGALYNMTIEGTVSGIVPGYFDGVLEGDPITITTSFDTDDETGFLSIISPSRPYSFQMGSYSESGMQQTTVGYGNLGHNTQNERQQLYVGLNRDFLFTSGATALIEMYAIDNLPGYIFDPALLDGPDKTQALTQHSAFTASDFNERFEIKTSYINNSRWVDTSFGNVQRILISPAPIPEPTTALLLGSMASSLLLARRPQKNNLVVTHI